MRACFATIYSIGSAIGRSPLKTGVFEIDIEHCPPCGGTLKIIAAIEHPKIVTHLGLPARAPPRAAARAFDRFQLA